MAGIVITVLIIGIGLLAVTLAAGSLASYESVKSHLDAFASDRDANLTRGQFHSIVIRLRIAAMAAALIGVAVFASRRRLAQQLAELAAAAASSMRSAWRGLGAAIADESRIHLAVLGVITVIAIVVRFAFLFQPMRYDETVTYISFALPPWYIALTTYTAPNNHVFHSLLVHISARLFGGDPWAIRLPAFSAGVLLVPASYLTARAFYGKDAALLTAALVAGSSVLIEYSTNARGYTMLTLVFVLLLGLATRLRASANPAEWLTFVILSAVGFFTVPVMLYGFGAVCVWLALAMRRSDRSLIRRRLLPAVVLTGILSTLLYAPIIASSGIDVLIANDYVRALPWRRFTHALPGAAVALANHWHRDLPLLVRVLLASAFLAGVAGHRRISRLPVSPALAAFAWIAPVVVAQRVIPFDRVWLFLLPLYFTVAAAGVFLLLRPVTARNRAHYSTGIALPLLLAVTLAGNEIRTQAVYNSEETSTFRSGQVIAAMLMESMQPADKVLVVPPADAILEYYLGRRGVDPAPLLYWQNPGGAKRWFVVVREGPTDFSLRRLLADPRLGDTRLGAARLLRRYPAATVYEVERSDAAHTDQGD